MAEDAELHTVVTEARHASLAGLPRAQQLRVDDDAAELAAAADTPVTAPDSPENAPAYVIYTSGSTGRPKGVVLPQQAVCNFVASMQREPGLKAEDRLLAVTTLSFDIAVLELFVPLVTGAQVVLAQREDAMDADALATLITRHAIGVMQATPTTWHLLLDAGWQAPAGFRALCGGEPLPPSWPAACSPRGSSSGTCTAHRNHVWSTLTRITDPDARITIGTPIANTQVWVLDEQMKPCRGHRRRDLHRRRGCRQRLLPPARTDGRPVRARSLPASPPARGCTAPATSAAGGEDGRLRPPGPARLPGQGARLPHRTRRDRGPPRGAARHRAHRRRRARGHTGDVRLIAYASATAGTSPDPALLRRVAEDRPARLHGAAAGDRARRAARCCPTARSTARRCRCR